MVLLAAVVGGVVLYVRGREQAPGELAGKNPSGDDSTVVLPAIRHRSPVAQRGQKEKRAPRPLSYQDVSQLLSSRRSSLRFPVDTLMHDRTPLAVSFSVDTVLQRRGEQLMRRYRPRYGAIAVLDPLSGRVLSLVSYGNEDEPFLGDHLYLRSLFPAASLFKMVTAAGAIEQGLMDTGSMLKQSGRNYTLYRAQLREHLDSYREITLEHAFVHSINAAFGRLGIYVLGRQGLLSYAHRFGFEQPLPFELEAEPALFAIGDSTFEFAELASGFNKSTRVSALFAALMCAAISEEGLIPRPRLVDSVVVSGSGEVVYTAATGLWRRAVDAQTAREIRGMMAGVTQTGTARTSFSLARQTSWLRAVEYGGKTGTVDLDGVGRIDWFAGFARDPEENSRRLALAVVTVHGPYWTVRSSYLAADLIRTRFGELDRVARESVAHAAERVAGGEQDG